MENNKKKAFKVEVEAYTQSNNPMWDDVELDGEESFEESYDTLEEAIENLRDVSKDIGWLGCYVTGSINKKEYISLECDEDSSEKIDVICDGLLEEAKRNKVIALDIETTGKEIGQDEILQLSIVNDKMEILYDGYFKPQNTTSWDEAMAINNITPEMVANAPSLKRESKKILDILNNADVIVGYNHRKFDIPFLESALDWKNDKKLMDVMFMYSNYKAERNSKGFVKYQKLTSLMDEFNFEKPEGMDAHNACCDTLATMFGYLKLKDMNLNLKQDAVNKSEPIDTKEFFNRPIAEVVKKLKESLFGKKQIDKAYPSYKASLDDGNVQVYDELNEGRIHVKGKYEQTLYFDDKKNLINAECTCPDCVENKNNLCKHIVEDFWQISPEVRDFNYNVVFKNKTIRNLGRDSLTEWHKKKLTEVKKELTAILTDAKYEGNLRKDYNITPWIDSLEVDSLAVDLTFDRFKKELAKYTSQGVYFGIEKTTSKFLQHLGITGAFGRCYLATDIASLYSDETIKEVLEKTMDSDKLFWDTDFQEQLEQEGSVFRLDSHLSVANSKQIDDFSKALKETSMDLYERVKNIEGERLKSIKETVPLKLEKFRDYKKLEELNNSKPTNYNSAYLEGIEKVLLLNKLENFPIIKFKKEDMAKNNIEPKTDKGYTKQQVFEFVYDEYQKNGGINKVEIPTLEQIRENIRLEMERNRMELEDLGEIEIIESSNDGQSQ